MQDLYDSNPNDLINDDFLPSLLETNCRNVSIENSNIRDIGFAYLFDLIFEQVILSARVLEYDLVDKNENNLDLNAVSINLSYSF